MPEVSEKGNFGQNRFKVCADRTVVTVFHSELKPIWEKDSLHAINLFQVNGVRETGHRQLNTLQSTNNFFAHVPMRTPSYARGESGKSPLSKSGSDFGPAGAQAPATMPGRRASKSALFDPSFQTQIQSLRTFDEKSSYHLKVSPKGTKKHLSGIEENSDEEGSGNVTGAHSPRQISLAYEKQNENE